jgi:hypothetical protein
MKRYYYVSTTTDEGFCGITMSTDDVLDLRRVVAEVKRYTKSSGACVIAFQEVDKAFFLKNTDFEVTGDEN